MRSFMVEERRARLARRHFLAEPADSIDGVVADLVGLHATDPATPYLSLWARLPGFAVADLDGAWTISRPRWTPMAAWLAAAPEPAEPEVARAELVRRWLRAFGPATVTDIKWWFGNTLTWARHALRDIDAVEIDLDGTPGFAL